MFLMIETKFLEKRYFHHHTPKLGKVVTENKKKIKGKQNTTNRK